MRPADFDDDTVLVPRAPGSAPAEAPGEALDELETDTVITPPRTADGVDLEAPSAPSRGENGAATADRLAPAPGYRWSLNGGPARSFDRPVLVGRSPRLPRVVDGVTPVLETVRSPGTLVSSTHLRLERQGTSVVVTDLRSTNGTLVTSPGAVRMALGPGDSIVAVPGTLIDIGDANIIEILPMERVRPSDPPLERLFP